MISSASTFATAEPLLHHLLEQIHLGNIQLPDFQRPWVWDDLHIRELIASLSLSYPIGAVMLMETGGEGARFKPRVVEGAPEASNPSPDKLILDGQQRLTSLYLALRSGKSVATRNEKGQSIDRVYFLDIEACLDENKDRLDAIISLPADRVIRSDFGRKVDLDVSTPEREYTLNYFPLDRIFDNARFFEWSSAYQAHYGYSPEKVMLFNRFQQEIWLRFQQFKVPVIELLKGTPKEAVCQVFEKVNTGGVALTVFELMTATFAADDFELRKDWQSRVDGQPGKPGLASQPVLSVVEETDFLTAVTLLASFERHLQTKTPVSCKRRDVLRLTLAEYQACADRVQKGLLNAARLLARVKVFDGRNLPYKSQLIPLAVICASLGQHFENDAVKEKLARWYWCGVFGELYGGASEGRFVNDVLDVTAWILHNGPEPRTLRDANFTPTRLLTLQTRQSAAYKGVMALLIDSGSHDFLNGDPIELTTYFDQNIDIHHIFPVNYCEQQKYERQRWNSVVNKAPLTARTNRMLGGKAPSRYLDAIQREPGMTPTRLDAILRSHVLTPEHLRKDDFDVFFCERATGLLNLIEQATGKVISGRDSEEVVTAFGAPLLSAVPA